MCKNETQVGGVANQSILTTATCMIIAEGNSGKQDF